LNKYLAPEDDEGAESARTKEEGDFTLNEKNNF
jgi:hypothetical protein